MSRDNQILQISKIIEGVDDEKKYLTSDKYIYEIADHLYDAGLRDISGYRKIRARTVKRYGRTMSKRLTRRIEYGGVAYEFGRYACYLFPKDQNPEREDIDIMAIKLCEFEDKIDQGKLVEVVRCKDCKFWGLPHANDIEKAHYCCRDNMWCMPARFADDYCSYGEKRDDYCSYG